MRLVADRAGRRRLARRARARTWSPSSGSSPSTTCAPSWAPRRPAAIAMLCAARRGLPVHLHTPSEVKAAVTGNGRADKAQVGAMVTRLLRLDAHRPTPADAADALALAIATGAGGAGWRARRGGRHAAAPRGSPGRQRVPVIAFVQRRGRRDGHRRTVPRCSRSAASGWRCCARRPRSPGCGSASAPRCRPAWSCARTPSRCTASPTTTSARSSSCCRPPAASGPRLAQAMLAVHSPDELRRAVASRGRRGAHPVPGIGQKGAQRIVLELKDRLGAPTGAVPQRHAVGDRPVAGRGASRCTPGWSAWAGPPRTPTAAVDAVSPPRPTGDAPDVAALLRAALRTLSRPEMADHEAHLEAAAIAYAESRTGGGRGGARRRRRRAGRRGRAAAPAPGRVHRPGAGPRAARAGARGRPRPRTRRPTTCCSPARPGWARPPWR